MTAIQTENLTKIYRKERHPSLDHLTLEIKRNIVFGFLGPNGAGKTTTIKILTSLMNATKGSAFIEGKLINTKQIELRKLIGYLPQEPKMYGWMTGKEVLKFVGRLYQMSTNEINIRADLLLKMSGLNDVKDKRISTYSGGMLQRMGIAQAMMGKPKVLFLDEPTSSLDPIGRKEVLEFIGSLSGECTVFMSTHILSDVERICDEIGIINKGKLVIHDQTDKLKKKYASGKAIIDFSSENDMKKFRDAVKSEILPGNFVYENKSVNYSPLDIKKEKHQLLYFISEHQIEINRLEWLDATLEDIFIKLVG